MSDGYSRTPRIKDYRHFAFRGLRSRLSAESRHPPNFIYFISRGVNRAAINVFDDASESNKSAAADRIEYGKHEQALVSFNFGKRAQGTVI